MIYRSPGFQRAWKGLSSPQQTEVEAAIGKVEAALGRPHLHGGIGLRAFGPYLEFRAGLQMRILVLLEGGDLFLMFVGSHDQVATYLKHNR